MRRQSYRKYIGDDSAIEAAEINAKATEKLGEKAEQLVDRMIASKDRADITMQEYLKLREDVAKYERKLKDVGSLIIRLGIPAEVIEQIDTNTVSVYTCRDPMQFQTKYRIEFVAHDECVRQLKGET